MVSLINMRLVFKQLQAVPVIGNLSKIYFMNLLRISVFTAVIVFIISYHPQSQARAAFIKPESVLLQVLEGNKPLTVFFAEVRVSVYDPEAFAPLDEESNLNLQPYEIKEKSYFQQVVFIRDEFVSIQTMDDSGNPMHIYIHEIGGATLSKSLSSQRFFSSEDVQFPAIILFTKHLSLLSISLEEMGIDHTQLQISHQKYLIHYLIGNEENHLRVDTNSFKALGINRQIQIDGRYYPMTIVFSDWDEKRQAIPLTTRFYVKSRLFKEISIEKIRFRGISTQRNAILKKYKYLLKADYPFSASTNWGQ